MEIHDFSWLTRDGLNLFARDFRPNSETFGVVCLVHGLGEHSGRYLHVAKSLTDDGFAVVTNDLRGHGKSEGIRGHCPSHDYFLEDLSELIQNAKLHYPGLPIFMYGHSLGGNLVLEFALRRSAPLAGLVVTSPGLKLSTAPAPWKLLMANILYKIFPTFALPNGLDRSGLSHDLRIVDMYNADPLVHGKVTVRFSLDALAASSWIMEHASELNLPILLLHGTADRIASFERSLEFSRKIKQNATFIPWEGGYHELHNEPDKQNVIQEMISWMREQVRTRQDLTIGY